MKLKHANIEMLTTIMINDSLRNGNYCNCVIERATEFCLSSRRKEKVDEPPNKILKLKLLIRILILKMSKILKMRLKSLKMKKRKRERERGVGKDRGVVVLINHCYEN